MTCQICKMVSLDASVETTAIASIHLAYILPQARLLAELCPRHKTLFLSLRHALAKGNTKGIQSRSRP